MILERLSIENYKSFRGEVKLHLNDGFTVITGPNNSGKSSLLQAMSLKFGRRPHRSEHSIPAYGQQPVHNSTVKATLSLGRDEFLKATQAPNQTYRFIVNSGSRDTLGAAYNYLQAWARAEGGYKLKVDVVDGNLTSLQMVGGYFHDPMHFQMSSPTFITVKANSVGVGEPEGKVTASWSDEVHFSIVNQYREAVFSFHAERMGVSSCAFGDKTELQGNAANLAEVLGVLQGQNRDMFAEFCRAVNYVIPEVKEVSVEHRGNNRLEIMLWPVLPSTRRTDLKISLAESGSGIGQVLSILYVALCSPHPRTIVIDEPSSFLHPGAAVRMVESLRENPKHQYIIATHSSSVISAVRPYRLLHLEMRECETVVDELSYDEINSRRVLLNGLGIRVSDVFGAEKVLWVEGPTEEMAIPVVVEKLLHKRLGAMRVLAVRSTGEFDSRRVDMVLDIYKRLSGTRYILPATVAFVFDSERKSESDIEAMKKRAPGQVFFLPRRMFENYLLDAEAITAVANSIETHHSCPWNGLREQPLSVKEVSEWLSATRAELKFVDNKDKDSVAGKDVWVRVVHGARLLEGLFEHFSGGTVEFRKTEHSCSLLEWLVENRPEHLADLRDFVAQVLHDGDDG